MNQWTSGHILGMLGMDDRLDLLKTREECTQHFTWTIKLILEQCWVLLWSGLGTFDLITLFAEPLGGQPRTWSRLILTLSWPSWPEVECRYVCSPPNLLCTIVHSYKRSYLIYKFIDCKERLCTFFSHTLVTDIDIIYFLF